MPFQLGISASCHSRSLGQKPRCTFLFPVRSILCHFRWSRICNKHWRCREWSWYCYRYDHVTRTTLNQYYKLTSTLVSMVSNLEFPEFPKCSSIKKTIAIIDGCGSSIGCSDLWKEITQRQWLHTMNHRLTTTPVLIPVPAHSVL